MTVLGKDGTTQQTLCHDKEPVRIVFLDVDGVLNIMSDSYRTSAQRTNNKTKWMEEYLIQRLEYLLYETKSKIVISSSWRLDMSDLKVQMERYGFSLWDRVIGYTPRTGHRGDEIQSWIDSHSDILSYVVLEDEPCDVCGEKCNTIPVKKVVQVDMKEGLSHKNIEEAIKILLKDNYV